MFRKFKKKAIESALEPAVDKVIDAIFCSVKSINEGTEQKLDGVKPVVLITSVPIKNINNEDKKVLIFHSLDVCQEKNGVIVPIKNKGSISETKLREILKSQIIEKINQI